MIMITGWASLLLHQHPTHHLKDLSVSLKTTTEHRLHSRRPGYHLRNQAYQHGWRRIQEEEEEEEVLLKVKRKEIVYLRGEICNEICHDIAMLIPSLICVWHTPLSTSHTWECCMMWLECHSYCTLSNFKIRCDVTCDRLHTSLHVSIKWTYFAAILYTAHSFMVTCLKYAMTSCLISKLDRV